MKHYCDYKTEKCKNVFKKYPFLRETWTNVYNLRKGRVGPRKAIYSADAVVLSEALKLFVEKKPLRSKIKKLVEEKLQYPSYIYKDLKVILTKDKSVLKDYPEAKPISELINNEFDSQVINDIIDTNNLKIDDSFYYHIMETE